MKRTLIASIISAGFLVTASVASADTLNDLTTQLQAALVQLQSAIGHGAVLGASTDDTPDNTTPAGIYCPQLSQTLRRGMRDATTVPPGQVSELQAFVTDYYDLDENVVVGGYFGRLTERYVKQFQTEQGLPAFGIAGSLTRARIAEVCGKGQTGSPHVTSWVNDLVGNATVFGSNLTGKSGNPTVTIGTAQVFVTYASDSSINIKVPSWVVVGRSYNLQVVNDKGISNIFSVTISSVSTESDITVTAPNGGEQWETGVTNTVTWAPYGYNPDINPSKDVTAYLEKKNASGGFETLGRVQEEGKASIHWLTGHLDPFGPGTWAPPGQYYIRVVNNITGRTDRSDAPFTILPRSVDVQVNGSDGPVTINPDEKVWVTWTSTGKEYCTLYGVSDTKQPPSNTQPSITDLPVSGKREVYVWFYDPSYGTSVNLTCVNKSTGQSASDWVPINTTPQAASVSIISPNGGEKLPLEAPVNISWSHSGVNSISIALYKNDQWKQWIQKDLPTNGSDGKHLIQFDPLTISDAPSLPGMGNVFKIYITGRKSDGSGYVDDKSDAPFSFDPSTTPSPYISSVNPTHAGAGVTIRLTGIGLAKEGTKDEVEFLQNGVLRCAVSGPRILPPGRTNTTLEFNFTDGFVANCPPGLYQIRWNNGVVMTNSVNFTIDPAAAAKNAGTLSVTRTSVVPSGANAVATITETATGRETFAIDWGDGMRDLVPGCSTPGSCGAKTTLGHTYTGDGTYAIKLIQTGVTPEVTLAETSFIVAKPTCTFTAYPTPIDSSQSSTLTWTSKNTGGAYMSSPDGQARVPVQGSTVVKPTHTMTYYISFDGLYGGGVQCSATVTVIPPASTQ